MKKSRYTEVQNAFALKQVEVGTPVTDMCRKLGIANRHFTVVNSPKQ
ncbi:MAG: transposase [Christensenellales bacterium]|jgi:putative transposase